MYRQQILAAMCWTVILPMLAILLFEKGTITFYIAIAACGIICIWLMQLLARFYKIPFPEKGLQFDVYKKHLFPAIKILLTLFACNFSYFKIEPDQEAMITGVFIFSGLVMAFAWEFSFRFYIQIHLFRLRPQILQVVLFNAGLYALCHGLAFAQLQMDVYGVVNLFIFDYVVGVLLSSLYVMTKSLLFVGVFNFLISFPIYTALYRQVGVTWEEQLSGWTIEHSLSGSLFFCLYISPLIIISFYYLWKVSGPNGIRTSIFERRIG